MEFKDIITIVLSSTVVSTFVTTCLSPILELIKSRIEQKKISNERRYKEEKELKKKNEEIYVNAIHIIQLIKNGFGDRTYQQIRNMPFGSSGMKEKQKELVANINEINNLIETTAPLMRLYATDEIYELFSKLTKYGKFSYSEIVITQFLQYSFDRDFTYMCKAMQKNLGLGFDTPRLPEPYICPYCGNAHNSEEDCPMCNMDWINAIEMEDKFNQDCENDKELPQLYDRCMQKGKDPLLLISYPINKDEWKKNLRTFLDKG